MSFGGPGTEYASHLGGAVLTRKILAVAADAEGLLWRQKNEAWLKENAARVEREKRRLERVSQAKGAATPGDEAKICEMPWPEGMPLGRPPALYDACLGLDDTGLAQALPKPLHSFGVWTPHPVRKGNKDAAAWRVQKHFGYGPADGQLPGAQVFRQAASLPAAPEMMLIDDGGILFRHQASQAAWPGFSSGRGGKAPMIVLKMSAPLCRGDLWPALLAKKETRERLIVIVSADDLRGEDALIRRRLSWEQSALDAVRALKEGPVTRQLLQAAHVVVNFRSAGALWVRSGKGGAREAELIFDPQRLEGDHSREFEGTVYGFQTCMAVAVTHHVMIAGRQGRGVAQAISTGIISGLHARRQLLELGHGKVGGESPGFPVKEIGSVIAREHGGFTKAPVPFDLPLDQECGWSMLADSQQAGAQNAPHVGLAFMTAMFGRGALREVPSLTLGRLFTVDRAEIESLRTLERLIREYESERVQPKPLSIGVFGPPGAGKSFGVKALAKAVLGDKVPVLEFNLSQFNGPEALIGAFHQIRDKVLAGITPVAFWDEFDSKGLQWLQYLLAPMQDGAFQDGQIVHPIGKCLFIFAGGTASTLEEFDRKPPPALGTAQRRRLKGAQLEERRIAEKNWHDFKLLKAPDFISRLHGHLNVLGPNPREISGHGASPDRTWPIRRALMLRGVLDLKEGKNADVLDMDPGLLLALLRVPRYSHGSRSFEKILQALARGTKAGHYHRSALPPDSLLNRETEAAAFHNLMRTHTILQDRLETVAAIAHQNYLDEAKNHGWPVRPEVDRPFDQLSPEYKAANLAAARRIPDHLALIDYTLEPLPPGQQPSADDMRTLENVLKRHMEKLAEAEHRGWCIERHATGWTHGTTRDDAQKRHPALVDWDQLSDPDKEKDRKNIRAIPRLLEKAGCKAVAVKAGR